jgi:S1-C subfamily serine protease
MGVPQRLVYLTLWVIGSGLGIAWSRLTLRPRPAAMPPANVIPVVARDSTPVLPRPVSSQPTKSQPFGFIAQAADRVGPAVVSISTPQTDQIPELGNFWSDRPSGFSGVGSGSGLIWSGAGQVVTNAHVIGGARSVKVTLRDGRTFAGQVVGIDAVTDIAAVKIEAAHLPTVRLGNSKKLVPGQWAIAIGNPLGLNYTVTAGIISAVDRSSTEVGVTGQRVRYLQTDAAINPGNSGGPLLNEQGEVIGMNTAICTEAQGLGFAIPIETTARIVEQLFRKGAADHPFLGIQMVDLTPEVRTELNQAQDLGVQVTQDQGILILAVLPHSPAAQAGLQPGDVIQRINTNSVQRLAEVQALIDNSSVGSTLAIAILRQGQHQVLQVQVGELPAP